MMLINNPVITSILRCPSCQHQLNQHSDSLTCVSCGNNYPIVNGIPVLINESNSVFSISDFVNHRKTTLDESPSIKNFIKRFLPTIGANIKGSENYKDLSELILSQSSSPLVLIIGGGIIGEGIKNLIDNPKFQLVETDVFFGPRTQMICDGHDLPFAENSFDCVIIQAVLEHVADPYRCVAEIHRVLRPNALVYAETPFMQQVHLACYDFTRFTHLGHRRLFRYFSEVKSGAVCGSGMALAWAYHYFLLSFAEHYIARKLVIIFSSFTAFFLKYVDYLIIDKPGTLDAASGFYFMGRKAENPISDREIIKLYRGAQKI